VATKLANATSAALDRIEPDPGIGLPTLGKLLGMPGLLTWRAAKFPLLWCYFERGDPLDVVWLLGERQDIAAILGDTFASN
jgi:toxin ParE1/3/4